MLRCVLSFLTCVVFNKHVCNLVYTHTHHTDICNAIPCNVILCCIMLRYVMFSFVMLCMHVSSEQSTQIFAMHSLSLRGFPHCRQAARGLGENMCPEDQLSKLGLLCRYSIFNFFRLYVIVFTLCIQRSKMLYACLHFESLSLILALLVLSPLSGLLSVNLVSIAIFVLGDHHSVHDWWVASNLVTCWQLGLQKKSRFNDLPLLSLFEPRGIFIPLMAPHSDNHLPSFRLMVFPIKSH